MTAARKKAPPRPAKPVAPTCDHCGKPCGTTIVRAASGVYCGTKHRRAREALLAAALEPAPVDVSEVMTQALARREVTPRRFIAPPILTPAGQVILSSWLDGISPDTAKSYQASARHFVAWAREHGFVLEPGSEVDAVIEAFQIPEDEGNAIAIAWVRSQAGQNRGSVATRCSGVRALCTNLKIAKVIGYVPLFKRPKKLRRTAMESFVRFRGVPEAFAAIVDGLEQIARGKDARPIDVRDWAFCRMCSYMGIRRIEVVRFDVHHADFGREAMWIHGKGRDAVEAFAIPKDHPLTSVLKRWISVRTKALGPEGPLFPSMGPTPPAGGRLHRGSLNALLHRRGTQFGVKLKPHDFRRIFCTEAIDKLGMRRAKDITRHADESTLGLYDMSAGQEMSDMMMSVGDGIEKHVRDIVKKGKKR